MTAKELILQITQLIEDRHEDIPIIIEAGDGAYDAKCVELRIDGRNVPELWISEFPSDRA